MARRFSVSHVANSYNGLRNVLRHRVTICSSQSASSRVAGVLEGKPVVSIEPASIASSCSPAVVFVSALGLGPPGAGNDFFDGGKSSTSANGSSTYVVDSAAREENHLPEAEQGSGLGFGLLRPWLRTIPAGATTSRSSIAASPSWRLRPGLASFSSLQSHNGHVSGTLITSSSSSYFLGSSRSSCYIRAAAAIRRTRGQEVRALHSSSLPSLSTSSASLSSSGAAMAKDDDEGTVTREAETVEKQASAVGGDSDYHRNKLVVLGGNGFVGSHICREALSRGINVTSVNRSGPPARQESWVKEVEWVRGDVFDADVWRTHLKDAAGVVSCIGGFGTNDEMRRINGEANVKAVHAAIEEDVKRFVLISAHYFSIPAFVIRGYYDGKQTAEEAVRSKFPYGGIILRPGFIHGNRNVGNLTVPLSVIGGPLEAVMRSRTLGWATNIPIVGALFVPPVKAVSVAKAAVRSATDNAIPPGVLDVWGIIKLAEKT